ncbi:MAG: cohesin domain-containing protein, partial [Bacteroidota bacterium]
GQNREAGKLLGSLRFVGLTVLALIYMTIAFTFRSFSDQVYNLLTLDNGSILVTGRFGLYKTRIREGVALINPNNRTIDGSFQPSIQRAGLVNKSIPIGDQLLVAGDFTQVNGSRVINLARINTNGSLDQSFQQAAIPSSKAINNIFIQSDGKIMVGTSASSLDPDPHVPINRLNPDGTTDNGFQVSSELSVLGNVNGFNELADGRLVVHGSYSILTDNGFFRQIGIFNQSGDFDPTLSNSISASSLNSVVLVNGNLLIGGNRIRVGDGPQSPMILVTPNGQEVGGFTSTLALTSNVQRIFPLANDQFLVSGQLFDGVNFRELARVNTNGALDVSFAWPLFGNSRPPVFPPRDVVELASGDLSIGNSEISASGSLWLTDSEGNPKDTIVVAERAVINDIAPASDTVFYVGGGFTIDAEQTSLVQLQLFQPDTSSNPDPETFSGFYITSDTVEVGEQVCVSFNAADLSDILGVQLVINYDAEKLAFDSVTNLNLSGLLEADFGLPGSSDNPPGIIRLVWIEPGLSGVTVSDTAQWFDLCFTAIATADSTEISISETEIVDLNDNLFSVETQSGKVTITQDMSVSSDTLFVDLSDEQVKQGEEVCVAVRVRDFDFIAGMQFNLNYDAAKLDFREIRNLNLDMLTPGSFGLPGVGANPPGRIKVSWFDLEVNGVTVPDETVIFEVCFTALAETGTDDITFSNIEIIGNENEAIDFVGKPSTISFLPADDITQPTFTISAGDATVAQGEEVCIPITVTNFEDLIGVGFKMTYDPSVLAYDRVRGFALPNLNRGSFDEPGDGATPLGEIEINWLDFTLNGINVDDGTVIFEVCFRALAETGSTALSFSEETILNSDNELVDFSSDAGIISFVPNIGVMADTLIVDIANDTVALQELFCVPVRVENFEDIVGLEFTINYDTNLLAFENVGNFNLAGLENSVTRPGDGVIPLGEFKVAWFDARVEGVTLPDSTILFELCFSSKASEANTALTFSDVEITGLVVDNVPFEGVEGNILIDENGGQTGFDNDEFLMQVIGDTVLTDDKFCLPVFVTDFDGISDLSFSFFYDPMVLRFDSVSALAFSDLGDNVTVNQVEGETLRTIRVSWSNAEEQGQSLPDSTQLMSFCFTAIDIGQTIVAVGTGSVQDATGETVTFQSENSRVVVNSRIIDENNFFTVKVSSDTVDQNENFCLDISVDNFEDILSAKFNLNY